MRVDERSAECLIYVYKQGLLSAVGHDLEIRATRFTIDFDDPGPTVSRIEAKFDSSSLRVVTAMQDGRPAPHALSPRDLAEIESHIARDVLDATRFPLIHFVATEIERSNASGRITGTLDLHGRARAISFPVENVDSKWVAELTIHQPDFGIRPYSALLGALKVKPDVKVILRVPSSLGASRETT